MSKRGEQIAVWLKTYRAAHPSARCIGPMSWRGGNTRKYRVCNVCGSEGGSFAAKWRRTVQSYAWETEHLAKHFGEEG